MPGVARWPGLVADFENRKEPKVYDLRASSIRSVWNLWSAWSACVACGRGACGAGLLSGRGELQRGLEHVQRPNRGAWRCAVPGALRMDDGELPDAVVLADGAAASADA